MAAVSNVPVSLLCLPLCVTAFEIVADDPDNANVGGLLAFSFLWLFAFEPKLLLEFFLELLLVACTLSVLVLLDV